MGGNMTDFRRLFAELLGTYVLVLGGTTAILSATASGATTRTVPIALAFGLALIAGLYAFGEVSGGHFNPAVSLAMLIHGKIDAMTTVGYWIAQVVGGTLASLTLLAVSSQDAVASTETMLGSGVEVWEGFLMEVVFTAIFLLVILKTTSSAMLAKTAFLGIGLTLTAIHLCLIPFTGTSVNPARSLGPAIVGGVWTDQWIYVVAPLVGAALGWAIHQIVASHDTAAA
jgi:aquaporin Z